MDLQVMPVIEQHIVSARLCIENGDPLSAEQHYRAVIALSALIAFNDIRLEGKLLWELRAYRTEAADFIMQREAEQIGTETRLLLFLMNVLKAVMTAARGDYRKLAALATDERREFPVMQKFAKLIDLTLREAMNESSPWAGVYRRLACALKGLTYPERQHLPGAYLSECIAILNSEGWLERTVNGIYMVRDAMSETMGADGERNRAWKMACESYATGRGVTTTELALKEQS